MVVESESTIRCSRKRAQHKKQKAFHPESFLLFVLLSNNCPTIIQLLNAYPLN